MKPWYERFKERSDRFFEYLERHKQELFDNTLSYVLFFVCLTFLYVTKNDSMGFLIQGFAWLFVVTEGWFALTGSICNMRTVYKAFKQSKGVDE